MSDFKFELNRAGVGELLKSAEMEAILREYASGIQGRAGEGFEMDTKQMSSRVIASVYADTEEAIEDNYENNTLLRALGG